MNIKPHSKVLEVGSGNNPRSESSILCDRLVFDNSQRAGEFSIVIDRPFVVVNGYHLPFKDKSFDYVICSHVLEHLEKPQEFVKELMRVGKAGYIEVPNIYGERLFGWKFHLWYCRKNGNTLVFSRKKGGEQYGGFLHRFITHSLAFRKFFEDNEDTFYIKYEWKNTINLKIQRITQKEILAADEKLFALLQTIDWSLKTSIQFWANWMQKRVKNKMKKILRRTWWAFRRNIMPFGIIPSLIRQMQCTECLSPQLLKKGNKIVCLSCKQKYPVYGVIPVMLSKSEQREGY